MPACSEIINRQVDGVKICQPRRRFHYKLTLQSGQRTPGQPKTATAPCTDRGPSIYRHLQYDTLTARQALARTVVPLWFGSLLDDAAGQNRTLGRVTTRK
jgi:hypothetical protein